MNEQTKREKKIITHQMVGNNPCTIFIVFSAFLYVILLFLKNKNKHNIDMFYCCCNVFFVKNMSIIKNKINMYIMCSYLFLFFRQICIYFTLKWHEIYLCIKH